MTSRKEYKRLGKSSLKRHYAVFVVACLIAAFLGAEFANSLTFSNAQTYEQTIQQVENDVYGDGSYLVHTVIPKISWRDVLRAMAEQNTEAGRKLAQEAQEEAVAEAEEGSSIFGRTRGVLSSIVNQISSGSILVTLAASFASITGSENLGIMILILLGAALVFSFWFLFVNTYSIVMRRIFLEGMIYDRVTPQRFTFLLRIRKWLKASWIMFVKYIFYSLWCLTIVGAIIKRYSYYLVPYIAAENPDMTARQAITLSRRMMDGHKWECFIFELSFLGWEILGYITLGLFNIFYTNPYKVAAFTQYYAALRAAALQNRISDAALLRDAYLYEKAADSLLSATYPDVIQIINTPDTERLRLTGWRGFFANQFGIILLRREQDRLYEKRQAEYVRIQEMVDDVKGEAYPVRLYPIPEASRRKHVESLNYMRYYSIWSLIIIFFSMSLIGWLWEVSLHLISDGVFVNRGAMHGPWLPIYGSGSVLILTLLYRFRKNPALEFTATLVVCGILEYMTSLVMEITTGGTKWWDYSGYFLNLNGRICAEGLLVFGIGGLAIVYVLAPIIDNLVRRIQEKALVIICVLLMAAFAVDMAYSHFYPNVGEGITNTAAKPASQMLNNSYINFL